MDGFFGSTAGQAHLFVDGLSDGATDAVLADMLRDAIASPEGQLRVVYQPILDSTTGRILAQEALVRWEHPEMGRIGPGEFIPVAERHGLIWALGAWVLRTACRQATGWPSEVRVAVNLSGVQLAAPGLVPLVLRTLAETGLEPARLELEISERTLDAAAVAGTRALHQLREAGVRVLLDDFGVGNADLHRLISLPLDGIKLDQAVVAATARPAGAAVVRAMLGLARELDLEVVAEGVETERQRRFLLDQGCRVVQGYLLAPPAA